MGYSTVEDYISSRLLKKIFESKVEARSVNTGFYMAKNMAFSHFSSATVLVGKFGRHGF